MGVSQLLPGILLTASFPCFQGNCMKILFSSSIMHSVNILLNISNIPGIVICSEAQATIGAAW